MKTCALALTFLVCATLAFSQGIGRIDGTVTDPSGAAIPAADVTVTLVATSQVFKTTTDEKGEWSVNQLPAGDYRVSVSKAGFKVAAVNNVPLAAGEPARVPLKMEVGQSTETVTVTGAVDIVQSQSADVTSTLTGRQVTELPFATRNAVELMVTQPGTATPTNPRSSTINGLPKGALNITIDGINTQDNILKSSDGFFSYIMPSVDSLEEVTLTTSAAGADSTAQGAAQIKFVTKSGTNRFHGGGFYQVRNTFFNSNYFFNNQNNLPRDILHLRQYGGHLGGPIVKDKVFFFANYEQFRNPATGGYSTSVQYGPYAQGNYTYQDTAGNLHTVNLFNIAASGNAALPAGTRQFPTTIDPIVSQSYAQVAKLTAGVSLVPISTDFNAGTYNFQVGGLDGRDFYTTRFDYNVTAKHHISLSYDYDKYNSVPDLLNNVRPPYPGTGAVLGTDVQTGQRSNRFVGTLALRSALTSRLTNELRGGLNGGTVLFFDALNDGLYSQWRGFVPGINYVSLVSSSSRPQRRNGPYKEVGDNLSYSRGAHQITGGFTWSQVNLFQQITGTESIPSISFGLATGDPANTGSAAPFQNSANFPLASTTQISTGASDWANLTGRVSSIGRRLSLNENTLKYGTGLPPVDRNEEQWWGFYGQDVWRATPGLTVTMGLRWEKEGSWQNLNHTYTNVDIASIWGLGGVGHEFCPTCNTGTVPTYSKLTDANTYHMPAVWAPSVGAAWQIPASEGPLGFIFGHHPGASVFRMGYSISTVREGSGTYQSVYGANQGLNVDASLSPSTYPADFGAPGSVLFRDAALPSRTGLPASITYPIPAAFTASLNAFAPNLKMGYVQSWNIGLQRELDRNTVLEVRYTGNHGLHMWRQSNLNEVNIYENNFLGVFNAARQNLTVARGGNINNTAASNNYGNQGLAGQVAIPFLTSALGSTCCTGSTQANYLTLGQAGSFANSIATSATFTPNMIAAGYSPTNFLVNPTVGGNGTYLVTSDDVSYYDAGQLEVRRRFAQGLQVQFNYSFAKSMANGATSSSSNSFNPTTFRNLGLDKGVDGFDIRQAVKVNYIYELPIGPGRRFLNGASSKIVKKALEGWETAGVIRVQSGTPLGFGNFSTVNAAGSGVVFNNITLPQLQSMVKITKTQNPVTGVPAVYYLPVPVAPTGLTSANNTNFINNTQAAWNVNNLTPGQVDASAPYIGPPGAGQMGCIKCYLYLPWQRHIDVSLIKVTHLKESVTLEIRAQALNVFNLTNFLPGSSNTSSSFGAVTSAYRDISGTYDPGGRILEFVARINF